MCQEHNDHINRWNVDKPVKRQPEITNMRQDFDSVYSTLHGMQTWVMFIMRQMEENGNAHFMLQNVLKSIPLHALINMTQIPEAHGKCDIW